MSELVLEKQLPKNWTFVSLDEIRINKSKTIDPSKLKNTLFELYSVPSYETNKPEIIIGNTIGSNKQTVDKMTVLLCKINQHINRVWIVDDHSNYDKIISTEWISFFKQEKINLKYFCYAVPSPIWQNQILKFIISLAQSKLTLFRIRNMEILISSIEEQNDIVIKIKENFSLFEKNEKFIDSLLLQCKYIKNSILKQAFEGNLICQDLNDVPVEILLQKIKQEKEQLKQKEKRMTREYLDDFVKCYNVKNRLKRKETEQFHAYSYDEIIKRDKVSWDIFWLKDDFLEDIENLPPPEEIAEEIKDNLESALDSINKLMDNLGKK